MALLLPILVFPFFLFIVGVSIVLALSKVKKTKSSIYFKIIKRTIIIFSIGLFLALFPNFDFENLRIAGVLQRIALVYLFCSVIYLEFLVFSSGLDWCYFTYSVLGFYDKSSFWRFIGWHTRTWK